MDIGGEGLAVGRAAYKVLAERCQSLLAESRRRYPTVVDDLEEVRRRRRELGGWQDWCWVPLSASLTLLQDLSTPERFEIAGRYESQLVHALALWRLGKSIYIFDPEFGKALMDSEIADDLPGQALLQIPDWCPYFLLPSSPDRVGCFVHLDSQEPSRRPILRVLLDCTGEWRGLVAFPVFLDQPLQAGMREIFDAVPDHLRASVAPYREGWLEMLTHLARQVIPLVLYLASRNADVGDPRDPDSRPERTKPRSTRGGVRWVGRSHPVFWEVGYHVGRRLRAAGGDADRQEGNPDPRSGGPRPHIRRAHWHTYWTDAGRAVPVIRWIHPILVAAHDDPDSVPPTVYEGVGAESGLHDLTGWSAPK